MPITNSGQIYAFDANAGVGPQDVLVMPGVPGTQYVPGAATVEASVAESNAATGGLQPKVNYLWYLLAIFILLVGMKFARSKESASQPSLAGIGVYNFIVIGGMSTLFILSMKVIFNKYPVKGLTQLFNAV